MAEADEQRVRRSGQELRVCHLMAQKLITRLVIEGHTLSGPRVSLHTISVVCRIRQSVIMCGAHWLHTEAVPRPSENQGRSQLR